MKNLTNLTRALLVSAAMLTSVAAGPQVPAPGTKSSGIEAAVSTPNPVQDVFIPPAEIKTYLTDWKDLTMFWTRDFHIGIKYSVLDDKEIVAHYHTDKQFPDRGFHMNRTAYESELVPGKNIHETYVPPYKMILYLTDWGFMKIEQTGKFRIDVDYMTSEGKEVDVRYQAMSQQKDGGFVMYRKYYNLEDLNATDVRATK